MYYRYGAKNSKKRLKIEKYLKQKYLIVQKLYHDKSQLKVNKISKKKITIRKINQLLT